MREFFEKFNELRESPNGKPILFFGFYFIFFAIIFLIIGIFGDKNALIKEYERGNQSTLSNNQILKNNFYYDYKVTLDGILYDYYGKALGNVESFKYNNSDYYKSDDNYFVNNGTWVKTENPIIFRDFIDVLNIDKLMNNAYYVSKTEFENGVVDYNFIISVNSINKVLYNLDTDYDDIPSSVVIRLDDKGAITTISFNLDNYCNYSDSCNSLKLELNYSMYGEVEQIQNPIE